MKRVVATCVAIITLGLACHKNQQPVVSATTNEGPFMPRPDSALTAIQVQRWLQVNSLLDSLSFAYRDSFKNATAENRLTLQKSFQEAQHQLCIRQGLRGGYDEYRYITAALALPINKALRDSVGIRVFP